jgi:hypothetical protein
MQSIKIVAIYFINSFLGIILGIRVLKSGKNAKANKVLAIYIIVLLLANNTIYNYY